MTAETPKSAAVEDVESPKGATIDQKRSVVSVLYLFRYADTADKFIIAVGILFAMGQGAALPCFAIVFGDSMTASVGNDGDETYVETMRPVLVNMGLLSVGVFVAGSFWQTCFAWAAERQGARIREDYFKKVITRDIAWFDQNDASALPTRMANEVQVIQEAIGAKTGQLFVCITQLLTGLGIGFWKGWELALVICALIPFMGCAGVYFAKNVGTLQSSKQAWFGKAGAVAEEIFLAIRVVASFGGEQRAVERFESFLEPARRGGIKAGLHVGASFGLVIACFAIAHAAAFWYGAHYMIAEGKTNPATDEPYTGAEILMVFMSVLMGIASINDLSQPLLTLTQARSSATDMKAVFEGESTIEDSRSVEAEMPEAAKTLSTITFKDVAFTYPSRPDNPILKGLNLNITKGQKVAFVGESGSGKSTVIQLLERFYDPAAGSVEINGINLKSLPLASWRQLVGYVGQEPVLFATSILENLRGGNRNISREAAEAALKKAQAWGFIENLPKKMDTFVGISGGQLSGGQKQRVAIARALAKKPQLLLLDEATSALDNESEKSVQAALDDLQSNASDGLTTITIAHRLSTIRNSSVIFVIKAGVNVEKGTHSELMAMKSEYFNLVQSQGGDTGATNEEEKKEEDKAHQEEEMAKHMERQPSGESKNHKQNEHAEEQARIKELANMKYKAPWGRLFRLAQGEWWIVPLAFFGALIAGANFPFQGYLISQASGGFYETCEPVYDAATGTAVVPSLVDCPDEMLDKLNIVSLLFIACAVGTFIGEFMKYAFFTVLQEGLIMKLRSLAFASLVRQDVGFFDDPKNGPGGLTTTLARQTLLVAQMTGLSMGNAAGAGFALLLGITLGFIGSWKLALVILAMVPFLVAAMAIVMKAMLGAGAADASGKYSVSGEIASEAILNIRTVRALLAEGQVTTSFNKVIDDLCVKEAKGAPMKGLAFGFGNAVMFTVYIAGFGYGAVLIDDGLEPNNMYQALMCIMFGAMGASFAATFSGDAGRAKLASYDVFNIIDRVSRVDAVNPVGTVKTLGDASVEFKDVQFCFPHRPDTQVLKGVSFFVTPGQSVALVGPSGSGKSTVIQLLQRFYDPSAGQILVGGVDLNSMDVSWWRQQIGFVGQEPILFDQSLEDNVKYGKPGATHEEVLAAAKMANMDYVLNGKVAWTDTVGSKGGKLSGGQKQRCAIARALIRNPKILLLDEATSALDSTSEKVVQAALDTAKAGRTTFTIAHRLSTIQDSDQIIVIGAGLVMERGTHSELMAHGGLYQNLQKLGGGK
eukprot:CAMPEP_0206588098 /NCGR_PEP_ID=MMETSP0325_2-20121206/38058_1 /ASSEMBLY_ACC=CAM_ASM_000347 /TAXON_ID=2866 /ORGANISM="Crypthecodinium cohnii, Strain Seligo" /LENGTH=1279 /DNA_ID=CAMNT_0054096267 /DNA_START=144 /DNA_END=3983 /DNA_ORIENTATION=+